MPLTEKRIAVLILRYIANVISPEEYQELMEGYVNLSTANRLEFEKMTNPKSLLDSLRDYYAYMDKTGSSGEAHPGDPESTDPPIPNLPFSPVK